MLWDLWMNGGVRKTQNIYYSKVQFALLSLVLKKQEERERKDLNTNTREQAQVRLDFRWQKGLLEAECNLSPRERSGNRVPSRNLGTSPGSCHPEAQSETWDWQHLPVRHFFSFQFQLKKTNNNKKNKQTTPKQQNVQNSVTVKQKSGTIKCDT